MAPLTLSFYEHFLRTLIARRDVEFITYDDLMWGDDVDYKNYYPQESRRWDEGYGKRILDRSKVYVLLQHDTDNGPTETVAMARLEERLGIRSSIMTFARWTREKASETADEYPIDWTALKDLESKGFCIGYHCNAMHIANFDVELACKTFIEDIAALKRKFNLRYFSPHGGYAGPRGETNSSLLYPDLCPNDLRWVHNRFSPSFDLSYSDGRLMERIKANDKPPDLREWTSRLEPGRRHRALIHSQYFHEDEFEALRPSAGNLVPWYSEFALETKEHGVALGAAKFWINSRPQIDPLDPIFDVAPPRD
jgi:hypothetical protein